MNAQSGKKIKPMLIYLLLSLLPVIAIVFFYYQSIYHQMENELLANDGRLVGKIAEDIDRGVISALDIMNRLYMNESLNEMADRRYESRDSFLAVYQDELSARINMMFPANPPVRACTVFTDNPTVFNCNLLQRLDAPTFDSDTSWYNPENGYENIVFYHQYGKHNILDKKGVLFSVIRGMNMYRNHSRYTKILKVDFVSDYFLSEMEVFNGSVYLTDDTGRVAASGRAELYGEALPFDMTKPNKYLIEVSIGSLPGWTVIGVSNVNNIRNSIMKQQITAIVFVLLITGVMLLVIYKLVNDIFKGRLRETQVLLEKRQAQLSALQSQVNPHFFFNVLETVRMKLLLSGEREHSTILMRMARLLRKLMLWKDDIVTVDEEISFIREFMSIQEYCFGERLSWSAEVECGVSSCLIPKMLLQTFIENACVHGIRDSGEKTSIDVFIGVKNGLLSCRVADDGNGMEPEVREQMRMLLSENSRYEAGIGIRNAVNRLKLYYGGAFAVRLESEKGRGTNVEITLPIQRSAG